MANDLTKWLEHIGLGEHAAIFASQGVDWDVLGDLTEQDLKELGLSLGDRKRLLKARAALDIAQSPSPTSVATPPEHSLPLNGSAPHSLSAPIDPAVPTTPSKQTSSTEPTTSIPHSSRGPLGTSDAPDAERRQLTVMFIDLVDSTPLAGRFDPEDMRRVLGIFHHACASAIEAHEGHIALYIGDGLLVYFGYPHAHEDDAVRSVHAALAVIAALEHANDRIEARDGVRLHVRVGIETGLVVVGEMGAGASLDRQAIVGETPAVAARLQSLAPADAIVVGPATEHLIHGSFVLDDLGSHALKGISEPVRVHRVMAPTDGLDRFEIRAEQGVTQLVGRTAELELLKQRWDQSADGEMRCVSLIGEPGIGKSRMLRAFRDSLDASEYEDVSFHCSAFHRDSPFWPIVQRLCGTFELDPAEFVASADILRIETWLRAHHMPIDDATLVLTTLLGIPTGDRFAAVDVSSPAFKRRTLDVLVTMIERKAERKPLLIVIEDVHWIDPSSLEFVRLMLERLAAARILVLLTARPEFKPGWTYPHCVQLNLDRLSRRDSLAMIDRLTSHKRLPRIVRDQIVAKTDGVPLFVEELTKVVLQSDWLSDAGSSYEIRSVPQGIAIPDTLQGSLLSRLDRLEPAVKETAQIAATVGREFDEGLLSRISSGSQDALHAALARLIEADIILPAPGACAGAGAYVFRHALIQEIAYQSLLLVRRRHYHGLIAAALEKYCPELIEREPERIAHNLSAAALHEHAIEYWLRAGERALARAAYEEAIAHAQRGLASVDALDLDAHTRAGFELPLLLVRGEAEHRLGRRDAIDTFGSAAQLAREQEFRAHFVQAALGLDTAETFLKGSGQISIALLDEALATMGSHDTIERARLLSRLARTLHMTGVFERGAEVAREAVELARRTADPTSLFDALLCEVMQVGSCPVPAQAFAQRHATLDELCQIAERIGDAHSIGHACARSLSGCLELGDIAGFERALQRYEEVAASGQHLVDRWCVSGAQALQGILIGDFDAAEIKAEAALALAESIDGDFASGVYGMQMFTIRREQHRLAEVAPFIKRFMDEHPHDATWRPGMMLVCSDLGYEAQARRYLDELVDTESMAPRDSKHLITLTYLAEAAGRLRERAHAKRIYTRLLPFGEQAVTVPVFTLCCGSVARYLGVLAGLLGDWTAAEAHFEYALRMDEQLHAWPWLAHTQHDFAVMLRARDWKDDRERAKQLSQRATATAKTLDMHALRYRMNAAAPHADLEP